MAPPYNLSLLGLQNIEFKSDIVEEVTSTTWFTDHGNGAYMDPTLFADHEQFGIPVDLAKLVLSYHVMSA